MNHPFFYNFNNPFAVENVRLWVHFVKQNLQLFQEVVEKNLRLTQDTMKKRDDAESVDNESIMSTSSNLEPFANDDLGIVNYVETI